MILLLYFTFTRASRIHANVRQKVVSRASYCCAAAHGELRIQRLGFDLGRCVALLLGWLFGLFRSNHLRLRDGPREHHEEGSCVVLHSSFDTVVDYVHQIHPVLLVFSRHARVALVGDVVESLKGRREREREVRKGTMPRLQRQMTCAPLQRNQSKHGSLALLGLGNRPSQSQQR